MTVSGDEPSDREWVPLEWSNVYQALNAARQKQALAIDVNLAISHYLAMIKGNFMEDEELKQLIDQISQEHKHALELIFKQRMSAKNSFKNHVTERIHESNLVDVLLSENKRIHFIPSEWNRFKFMSLTEASSKPKRATIHTAVFITNESRKDRTFCRPTD